MKPTKYDMTKKEDVKRWFIEMGGYLRTSNIISDGTDFEGRKFAIEGFMDLQFLLTKDDEQ